MKAKPTEEQEDDDGDQERALPERGRHGRSRLFHQRALIIIRNGFDAIRKRLVDLVEARLRVLDHLRRVCAIKFQDETGDGLPFAIGSCEPLPDAAADGDFTEVVDADGSSIHGLDRRFTQIIERSSEPDPAHRVLFGANFDELRAGRPIGALQGGNHLADAEVIGCQLIGIEADCSPSATMRQIGQIA